MTLTHSGWGLRDEGLDLKGSQAKRVFSFIKRSILTLLESVSEDFESKNGIRGSELTVLDPGWGLIGEGLDLSDAFPSKEVNKRVFSFIVDFDPIGVCFKRF